MRLSLIFGHWENFSSFPKKENLIFKIGNIHCSPSFPCSAVRYISKIISRDISLPKLHSEGKSTPETDPQDVALVFVLYINRYICIFIFCIIIHVKMYFQQPLSCLGKDDGEC